jgi:SAM-dependent methyltransferase
LDRYYAEEFDAGQTDLTKPRYGIRAAIKRWPGVDTAWGKLSKALKREEPGLRQIRAFLEGIIETNGSYYLRRPDIRKVLEIGCGYGGKLTMFRRLGYETYGVEASRLRAEECRRQGLKVFDCPVTDLGPVHQYGPYDFAYSIHVLEHIGDVSGHFAQLSKLIRDGGFVYIQVPNLWLGEMIFMQSHTPIHCHTFSLHSLSQLMIKHGFVPIRVQADNNLHVLACKTVPSQSLPLWSGSAPPSSLLECLSWEQSGEDATYRVSFDHAQVEVTRLEDGRTVYRRNPFFSVQELPYRHTVDFSVKVPDGHMDFPVRFLYKGDRPPVWVKRQ